MRNKFKMKITLVTLIFLLSTFLVVGVYSKLSLFFWGDQIHNRTSIFLARFFRPFPEYFLRNLFCILVSYIQITQILKILHYFKIKINIVIYSLIQLIITLLLSSFIFYYTSYFESSIIFIFTEYMASISLNNIIISGLLKCVKKSKYHLDI